MSMSQNRIFFSLLIAKTMPRRLQRRSFQDIFEDKIPEFQENYVNTHKSLIIRNARIMGGAEAAMIEGDLLIEGGKIRAVGTVPSAPNGVTEVDAGGKLVLPGLVDPHTHYISAKPVGYRMLIAAGVTTALDTIHLNGPAAKKQVEAASQVGLNCAALYLLMPGRTLRNDNPGKDELLQAIRIAREEGFFGLKIAGAHFPLTPDAVARAVALAAENRMPLMIHAGSTLHRDDLAGMRETVECCGDNPAILAHVNVYCDGTGERTQCEEVAEAIAMLNAHPRIVSESNFDERSCVGCRIVHGIPESACLRGLLRRHGYDETYDGMLKALADGTFLVSGEVGGACEWLPPTEGVALAKALGGAVTVSVRSHDPEKNLRLLEARRCENGPFVITACASDAGVIPENIVLQKGLEAVENGRFSLADFVRRASQAGAWMLGLDGRKGCIEEGADGDVIIVDEKEKRPEYTIAGGHIVYCRGRFFEYENQYMPCPDHTPAWLN